MVTCQILALKIVVRIHAGKLLFGIINPWLFSLDDISRLRVCHPQPDFSPPVV